LIFAVCAMAKSPPPNIAAITTRPSRKLVRIAYSVSKARDLAPYAAIIRRPSRQRNPVFACCIQFARYAIVFSYMRRYFGQAKGPETARMN
jgi:hypothetical protein